MTGGEPAKLHEVDSHHEILVDQDTITGQVAAAASPRSPYHPFALFTEWTDELDSAYDYL